MLFDLRLMELAVHGWDLALAIGADETLDPEVVMPGPRDGGGDAAYLGQFFTSVRAVATLSNPYGLQNQQWHGHVYLCTGPRHPWGQMWLQLRQSS